MKWYDAPFGKHNLVYNSFIGTAFGLNDLQWNQIIESSLSLVWTLNFEQIYKDKSVTGAFRESNSGPLAPKARIIPLDKMPCC